MSYLKKQKLSKWGFVNEKDEPICGFIYDEVRDFSEGIAAVRVGNKWGYINENGVEICEIRYETVGDFQSNLGVVDKEGKRCYLNPRGEEVNVTNFMNEEMVFEGCKSCAIGNHTITNLPGGYLYEDELINVTIDPEIPIKGYMILAISKETLTVTDLTQNERNRLIDLANRLLEAMHKSGFEKVMIYQDESNSGNLHINFIPRHEWTYRFHANFGEMGIYAKNNLNTSDEYREELLKSIEKIKKNFK